MSKFDSETVFNYVNSAEKAGEHRSTKVLGEVSWGFVTGYLTSEIIQTLVEMGLTQAQYKVLNDKFEYFKKVLDSKE